MIFDGDTRTVLLQFWHSPNMFQEQRLTSLGVELLQASPGNAYHAHVRRDTFGRLMAASFVRGAAPLEVEDRLARSVVENDIGDYAMTKDGRMRLVWRGYRGTSQAELMAAAVGIEGVVLNGRAGRDHAIFIEATQQGARALAGLDITHWIEPVAPPPAPSNVQAAQASGVEVLYGAPSNLTGAGVNVMVLDGGAVRSTHDDLVGRVTILESAQPSGEPYGDHATHVAGTIAGTGASNAAARGMATSAQLYSYSFLSGLIEEQVDKLEDALQTYGCILSNHSWGYSIGYRKIGPSEWAMGAPESDFGLYTGVSADWDEAIYEDGLIVVKAAGNDRNDGPDASNHDGEQAAGDGEYYDLIGPLAGVKNAITVGAASDAASYLGDDGITVFTCFGPTDDGRLKPEIVFNGHDVLSCSASADSATTRKDGTSMATPGVTGTIALLMERHNTVFGAYPSTSWLRAVLTCYATDLGRPGPDYQYGYGILDATWCLYVTNNHAPASPYWL
ncbi:MAG: S8 family serine peptidase, partial [Planctomycetota bacterium]